MDDASWLFDARAARQHPVLTELLRRIMRQEGRHIDFYASQATTRLGASRAAQRLTRLALAGSGPPSVPT